MPEHDADLQDAAYDAAPDDTDERDDGVLDRLRGGVGTQDPNIVGDAGPTDVAPGSDGGGLIVEGPADHVEV